ncbi:MAG TPA: zinc ribbon domain-containing protein [Pyrinomonadaceae bacterium]|jgi:predicted RNA-binding Zn-ribbon protein involved in translation (DUF1610 family)
MSEPEIARRCPKCGASIREAAFFCPQCGNESKRRDSKEPQASTTPVTSQANQTNSEGVAAISKPKTELGSETLIERRHESSNDSHSDSGAATQNPELKNHTDAEVKAPPPKAARASTGQTARGGVGAQIQRATTLARDVEVDVIHRAKKVREISSVVLDEAGDDPSLRFVLVAAILFLLFLVIVVMNKFIN